MRLLLSTHHYAITASHLSAGAIVSRLMHDILAAGGCIYVLKYALQPV